MMRIRLLDIPELLQKVYSLHEVAFNDVRWQNFTECHASMESDPLKFIGKQTELKNCQD